jgi:hypothetical protein
LFAFENKFSIITTDCGGWQCVAGNPIKPDAETVPLDRVAG